ncbi:TetR/AcrR family transcriptional regulator [Acaryochloris marina]|uniref:Transcriptional regulator, TetR family, putative n=1 Tax=Acaryochloris marina (strain MBIC 11017) TaxID=329726 RepID=A8ZQH3_ACAM1|nr:TetR/AcrR family transcriptional regulator [Acaryochloris marina]ABW25291.1 transcriptional regulator, TetR family, putative [Acaryochloris marina MBIC11017]ABW33259.1 transcriptional regulator, TetR family, putative [Acaryochloris marina MBIC11017]
MSWARARSQSQKAARREEILEAAQSLFSELAYEEISLNGIAREAGISKANIYRYFSTREEIFLVIYEAEQIVFVRALINRLQQMASVDNVSEMTQVWVETLLQHETLLNLIPQLSISMERNSSVEQLIKFKKQGYTTYQELLESLVSVFPRLNQQQWIMVIQCTYSMIAGLWPLSNPSENLLEALRHPEVNQPPWEFESTMTYGLSALIHGAIAINNE